MEHVPPPSSLSSALPIPPLPPAHPPPKTHTRVDRLNNPMQLRSISIRRAAHSRHARLGLGDLVYKLLAQLINAFHRRRGGGRGARGREGLGKRGAAFLAFGQGERVDEGGEDEEGVLGPVGDEGGGHRVGVVGWRRESLSLSACVCLCGWKGESEVAARETWGQPEKRHDRARRHLARNARNKLARCSRLEAWGREDRVRGGGVDPRPLQRLAAVHHPSSCLCCTPSPALVSLPLLTLTPRNPTPTLLQDLSVSRLHQSIMVRFWAGGWVDGSRKASSKLVFFSMHMRALFGPLS